MLHHSTILFCRISVGSDSEEEKPKAKAKHKKSVEEDVKEVTKSIKNVSISNKSRKKKDASSDDGNYYFFLYCIPWSNSNSRMTERRFETVISYKYVTWIVIMIFFICLIKL